MNQTTATHPQDLQASPPGDMSDRLENLDALRDGFSERLPELYGFAYQVCGDREDARRYVADLAERYKQWAADGGMASSEPAPRWPNGGTLARL